MANDPTQLAPRPALVPIYDDPILPLHWYGQPGHTGGGWTAETALAATICELTVHWTEERTLPGQPQDYYRRMLNREAHYHAFERVWGTAADGTPVHGDGLMYHYAITPTGTLFQTAAETARTWNAYAANASNIAIVLLAGPGDGVAPAAVATLIAWLNWMTRGRADLPGATARPQRVTALGPTGATVSVGARGVLTHDESLIRQGRGPKGCPGPYAGIVQAWRAGAG